MNGSCLITAHAMLAHTHRLVGRTGQVDEQDGDGAAHGSPGSGPAGAYPGETEELAGRVRWGCVIRLLWGLRVWTAGVPALQGSPEVPQPCADVVSWDSLAPSRAAGQNSDRR